jgi:uncharacterized protein (DUF1501 family)
MPEHIDRRDFLRLAGLGGGAAMLGALGASSPAAARSVASRARSSAPATGTEPYRAIGATADVASRILVVLEMAGGNDGPSMAPPSDIERLLSLRPSAAHPIDALLAPGNGVMLHPAFERLQHRPLTLVDGIGSPAPDLSHFEMLRRWWAGDADGTSAQATGFLGRLCDVIDSGAPVTGLSVGGAATPALVAERSGTLGLPPLWWLWWLGSDSDTWEGAFRDGLAAMSGAAGGAITDGPESDLGVVGQARSALANGLRVGDIIGALPDDGDENAARGYPDSALGQSLSLTATILAADLGVRVVHVPCDGDFDTHEGHRDRHDTLMAELDGALDAFLGEVDSMGFADRVLVATTSEFGRRAEENGDGGLDHGTASTMLLAGPVALARIGEPPSYDDLDDDGNVAVTMSFDRYLATLATWLGVPPADVLPGSPEPLPGLW